MSLLLYNLFLKLYSVAVRIVAQWNPKAGKWISGRKDWKKTVDSWARKHSATVVNQESLVIKSNVNKEEPATHNQQPATRNPQPITLTTKTIWMHCASLGEFEQGRPLLEAVKTKYPDHKIVLTFFSPSGYEIRKNFPGADLIMYLPMDSIANARNFINAINPALVLWIKYEYWYYYLSELKKRKIPILLISGIFREGQIFFKWYGFFWKQVLESFEHLFVQTEKSKELLQSTEIKVPCTISGDTRYDRVIAIADQWENLADVLEQFCLGQQVVVAGSTWEEDEEQLVHYAKAYPKIRFLIAPHEVDKERILELQQEFPTAQLYSALINGEIPAGKNFNVIIIDNIGMLSRLYKYATVTYVGGGFNQTGIHNILEAAVYGKPVVFGPVYEKFAEARDLVEAGGAFSIETALELETLLNSLLNNPEELESCSQISKEFVYSRRGATQKIMEHIQRNRLLIN